MKTYDIINAGCNNRFMANGRIVSNSGRNIQLQNLPRNFLIDLTQAREMVKCGTYEEVEMLYDDVPDTLSQLIRTALVPQKGCKFIVADFSAIEARVLAWLAGEEWRMMAFANGEDIYCASASQMFGVPVQKHGINGHLRQKGKVAELACIAEGELVLTNHGLIPIEKVTLKDKLWDGENWVNHDGVIYKGEREVITYEGLTATPDHLVWIEGQSKPIQFGIAAACQAHLVQTGNGRRAIWLGENHQCRKAMESEKKSLLCPDTMSGMWCDSVAKSKQSGQRKIKRLSVLFAATSDTTMARQKINCCQATLRKPKGQGISKLWCKRYPICIPKCNCRRIVSNRKLWNSGAGNGNRPYRRQWKLCSRQFAICNTYQKQSKQTYNCFKRVPAGILALCLWHNHSQAIIRYDERRNNSRCRRCGNGQEERLEADSRKTRLYDIRNAGEHHRFTVSGKLVHNCGYGGSIGAMKAMGADEMGLTDSEIQQIVTDWRDASPHIVQLWWEVDRAVKKCIREKTSASVKNLFFRYESRFLFITLPSGRRLAYVKPRIGENKFGRESVTYMGLTSSKKWERLESYGPKFVENITQAIARDILCFAMKNLQEFAIVAHIHDEVVIEADRETTVEEICDIMGQTPPWAKGLLLRADGYENEYYKKD